MICIGNLNFNKNSYISVISVAKQKHFVIFAFKYALRSHVLLNCDFCMNLYSVDRDEMMKRGDKVLNASSLQFLRSIKPFIATIFYSGFNTSLLLVFKKNLHLILHCRYLLKEIHCLTLHSC